MIILRLFSLHKHIIYFLNKAKTVKYLKQAKHCIFLLVWVVNRNTRLKCVGGEIRGAHVVNKVKGRLPRPEIQSVMVQIQLDGVHHAVYSLYESRRRTRPGFPPIHATDLFSPAPPGQARVRVSSYPPHPLKPSLSVFLIANPGLRGRQGCVQTPITTSRTSLLPSLHRKWRDHPDCTPAA